MPGERLQRHIDRLLDEAEGAITRQNWPLVGTRRRAALGLNPDDDARDYLAAAERRFARAPCAAVAPAAPTLPQVLHGIARQGAGTS